MIDPNSPALLAGLAVAGYSLGSIPFGLIATRLGGAGDLRQVGSGNIGATNVLRTGRRDLAAITLIGDGGKGAAAVLLAHAVAGWGREAAGAAAAAGGAAFLGHLFPVWLRFRGGKGLATSSGVLLAAAWPAWLAAGLIWAGVAAAFRLSSLAALSAAALTPILCLLLHQPLPITWLALVMAALIFLRHVPNIRRLIKGEEPRIGGRKAAAQGPVP